MIRSMMKQTFDINKLEFTQGCTAHTEQQTPCEQSLAVSAGLIAHGISRCTSQDIQSRAILHTFQRPHLTGSDIPLFGQPFHDSARRTGVKDENLFQRRHLSNHFGQFHARDGDGSTYGRVIYIAASGIRGQIIEISVLPPVGHTVAGKIDKQQIGCTRLSGSFKCCLEPFARGGVLPRFV